MPDTLYYPYLKPGTLPLNRFLASLRDRDLVRRFLADPQAVLAPLDLTDEQRQALVDRDVPRLVALGAHPLIATLVRIALELEAHPEKFELY